ncbi:MAG: hypothetical protein IKO41_07905 [Lachnospiraceae bacterium]|nr:hypothetical protein [Lachnospiraceae bacterium]MBR3740322.1 hypothetical protein [Clostridia bacterium]MBR4606136.1 hypothetical protein [Lachnospiraceae bacterium]MBR6149856.1 hypothetical protein [Lachnospiraceae bacterium]
MGKEDKSLKNYFEDPRRFADAWNAVVYKGQQVIKAEELHEVNSVFTAVTGSVEEERIADMVMKRTRDGNDLGILVLENNDKTDFSMPVRIFHEEALAYLKQVREIEARNRVTAKQLRKMGRPWVNYFTARVLSNRQKKKTKTRRRIKK